MSERASAHAASDDGAPPRNGAFPPPSDNSRSAPEASTESTPPAPGEPSAEGAIPPRRGPGRPPGAKNKPPGTKRVRPSRAKPKPPRPDPSPFDGTPGGDAPPPSSDAPSDGPRINVGSILPPKELAALAVDVLGRVAVMGASRRYPDDIAASMAFAPEEKRMLIPLLEQSLATYQLNLDPGTAFVLVAGVMFGLKALACEGELAARRSQPAQPLRAVAAA